MSGVCRKGLQNLFIGDLQLCLLSGYLSHDPKLCIGTAVNCSDCLSHICVGWCHARVLYGGPRESCAAVALIMYVSAVQWSLLSAGLYGCELWGLLSIPGLWSSGWTLAKFYSLKDPLEVKRCRLVRQWLQLPQSVPLLPLLHELGCEHLVHSMCSMLFAFITAFFRWMRLQYFRVCYDKELRMLFAPAFVPLFL